MSLFSGILDQLELDLSSKVKENDDVKAKMKKSDNENDKLKSEVRKIKSDIDKLTKETATKGTKIKLLLSNQRKSENQLKKNSDDFNEMVKCVETLKNKAAEKEVLEVLVETQKKRILELETALELNPTESNASNGPPMPWDIDPELEGMSAIELRSILNKELSPRERSRLNEMCVSELQKDLKTAQKELSKNIWEISSLKKDNQKLGVKIEILQKQQNVAKAVLDDNEKGGQKEVIVTSSQQKRTASKRKSSSFVQINEAAKMTKLASPASGELIVYFGPSSKLHRYRLQTFTI